jgi:uncharacterized protein (TIRG00374 family)
VIHNRWVRVAAIALLLAAAIAAVIWRGPSSHDVAGAFRVVSWRWVLVAIGLNLISVVARSLAWRTVIVAAMPPPRPRYPLIFSAFCVGLFANAILPGRIGELARVAVLTRQVPDRGAWATLGGTVFAHRVFDMVPVLLLVVYVLFASKIPQWAVTSLELVVAAGALLMLFAFIGARRFDRSPLDSLGPARRLLAMARNGLGVMRSGRAAAEAVFWQLLGWTFQLFAVWAAMRAFQIHERLDAAALVLVLMNVATIFPLWPGNIGLVQAAVALPLVAYGVAYARGFAFGIGLQAIEVSVGVGVGLIFLAREGLSYAMLRDIPEASDATVEAVEEAADDHARARVAG